MFFAKLHNRYIYQIHSYLPVFVIIISVPRSWNLSHKSLVSKWHSVVNNSSQLQEIFAFAGDFSGTIISGDSRSASEPQSETPGDSRGSLGLGREDDSLSEHSSTSTSTSSSSKDSSRQGELAREVWPVNYKDIEWSWINEATKTV